MAESMSSAMASIEAQFTGGVFEALDFTLEIRDRGVCRLGVGTRLGYVGPSSARRNEGIIGEIAEERATMAGRTLRVVESTADGFEATDDVFVIESALRAVPAETFEAVFRRVAEADLGRTAGLPLYGVIRIHLAFLFAQNRHPPMAIPHLVVLYRLLDDRLTDHEYEALRCEGIAADYRAVVRDVAAGHGVSVHGAERVGFRHVAWGFLHGLYGYGRLVLDQVVSLLWKSFQPRPAPTRTVVVPHVKRFESIRPVLDRLDHDFRVVLPIPTLAWLRHRDGRYRPVRRYHPTPVDAFATPARVLGTVRRGLRLTWAVLVRRSFDRRVRRFVAEEFGVTMPNTVSYVLGNLFAVHVPSLANTVVAEGMVADLDPEHVVVGSLGSRQQAILYAAIDAGVDTYHVPHSATTGYELVPPPGTVHFVAADHVVDHLAASDQLSSTANVVPAGRAQLVALRQRDITPRADWSADGLKVLVATQPFPDAIRNRFIDVVLDALETTPTSVDVVVKIHPNETPDFYERATNDRPFPVRVVDEDLHGHVAAADLVVTINSNVGLEAMVLGTPCVCVTAWEPLIRARPYATAGPVPVLETTAAATEFFADLTPERLDGLAAAEQEFVETSYLEGDPAERIARIIEAESPLPDDDPPSSGDGGDPN